ncbi:MAG: metallopeptidase family protein [Planctomycetaceae bacterium]
MHLTFQRFCDVVREAVDSLPESFRPYLENVVVDVQDEPTGQDYAAVSERGTSGRDRLLLGLFVGVPLTEQRYGDRHPNVIKIFKRPMERFCPTRKALLRNIRATVVHEFAHHFGFSEEQLEAFEQAQAEFEEEN